MEGPLAEEWINHSYDGLFEFPSSFTGAVVLQPFNRFSRADRPETVRYLECSGTESHISQCAINSVVVEQCGRFEVAGVVCQSTCFCQCAYTYALYQS